MCHSYEVPELAGCGTVGSTMGPAQLAPAARGGARNGAAEGTIQLRIGCRFENEMATPAPALVQVEPHAESGASFLRQSWELPPGSSAVPDQDHYGNRVRRLVLPAGTSVLGYDAVVSVTDRWDEIAPEASQVPVEQLPTELLHYLLPSRFCPSDLLMDTAWRLFGNVQPGWPRVQAICDWVHGNLAFEYGASDPTTTAKEAFDNCRGVCRDFAHLAISFCRALNVPARYVFGYIPDIGVPPPYTPMDFCAWMEVSLDGRWWTFDPRNNQPRVGRVLVGRGRDALDVAMITTWGSVTLNALTVWADEIKGAS